MSSLNIAQGASTLLQDYRSVRQLTEELCSTLSPEDATIQSMPDASPVRWHLAHTTWFFETFLLRERPGYRPFCSGYEYLFNSYYNAVGKQFPRPQRGLLSRPSLEEIYAYRRHVDDEMTEWLADDEANIDNDRRHVVALGLNHEQQHQELILTDVKHALSMNPLGPAFRDANRAASDRSPDIAWVDHAGGVRSIGHTGGDFAYDNELPRHEALLHDFELASRPTTCREYLQFIEDGGYQQPQWWLSEGWLWVQEQRREHPLYWRRDGDQWRHFTLAGVTTLNLDEPVCHLCYFEADAYARWAGARLPTEAEWEVAAAGRMLSGNFVDVLLEQDEMIHPRVAPETDGSFAQLFGDVWEWTASPYTAYPGYRPKQGALGEYNGKFMCNQFVLRGGSCATPSNHIRATYRNFFPPSAAWQFSGVRLARDVY